MPGQVRSKPAGDLMMARTVRLRIESPGFQIAQSRREASTVVMPHRTLSAGLISLGILFTAHAAQAADARPNILYCLADDWSWPHAGAYGDHVIRTPTFDRLARQGILFNNCFSAAPSCTPSRAAMLTGQYPHRLEEGSCLWGFLSKKFPVYPDLLEKAGYTVGCTRKGWGPGNFKDGGFTRNPAGPEFRNFAEFLKTVPEDKPFCFWFGSYDPHRPYKAGVGASSGLKTDGVIVPPFWPDNPAVRNDVLDYYWAVERFDREVGQLLAQLDQAGRLDNTIVVVTGDNGWPFPRCKANLYDGGTRQPLAVCWPARIKPGQVSDDFINLMDLAPTFLDAARLTPLPAMTGKSFFGLLTGAEKFGARHTVFLERERHASVRVGNTGYPMRAIRTRDFLYIRNFRPERWPAGDPEPYRDPKRPFGDCDDGPTKNYILDHRDEPGVRTCFQLCFAKRPAEELYDLKQDPHQIHNVAGQPVYRDEQAKLRADLLKWMKDTADPRAVKDDDHWDAYPYYGGGARLNRAAPAK
jgi:N-sulfoglucosamine sulfohydrolase